MRTLLKAEIILVFFTALIVTSCLDTDVDLTGNGDAYVLVEMKGQDTVKGLGLHAFSYSEFKTVTVTVTGNSSLNFNLDPYLGYKQDFVWFTPQSQYSKTFPATGEYVFNAVFADDQQLMFYDRLTSDYILPPKITKCGFNPQSKVIEVEWEKVKLADAYNVRVTDTEGKILFVSPVYNNSVTSYTFNSDTQGWQKGITVPVTGQKVKLEVSAYLMESLLENNELQCISRSRFDLTWE